VKDDSTLPISISHQHPAFAELEQQIRVRAYELYEQRGKTQRPAEEDWLQAEAEILSAQKKATAA